MRSGALLLVLCALTGAFGCSPSGDAGDAGADASVTIIDVCDAFTGVGTACPLASPVRCFPACEASGCFCEPGEGGAVWACETDLSCVPDCGPLDDGCGGNAPEPVPAEDY
jgi:hypothetical protein